MIDGNLAAEYRLPDLTKMSKQTENLYPKGINFLSVYSLRV